MGSVTVEVREKGRSVLTLIVTKPLVVGRDCDGLLLSDSQISRRHLEMRPVAGGLEVLDLSSTNGTFAGEDRLAESLVLGPGEEVRLGSSTVRVIGRDVKTQPGLHGDPTTALDLSAERTSIELVADLVTSSGHPVGEQEHHHGTVTIVFSDIEGSTDRNASIGDEAWFETLSAHNEIIRAASRRFGGTIVKNQGDGFMMTFPSARRALRATVDMQRRFETERPDLRIRVGMHTGEAIVDDDGDLFGWHVNFAARVAAQADGGEILVSGLTRAILETRGDIVFGDPRSAELKGIPGVHALHPIDWREITSP